MYCCVNCVCGRKVTTSIVFRSFSHPSSPLFSLFSPVLRSHLSSPPPFSLFHTHPPSPPILRTPHPPTHRDLSRRLPRPQAAYRLCQRMARHSCACCTPLRDMYNPGGSELHRPTIPDQAGGLFSTGECGAGGIGDAHRRRGRPEVGQ
jgi:hypothetical protein